MPVTSPADAAAHEPHPSLVTITYVAYGLQALGLGLGAFAAITVMGMFGFGWPSVVGIVITYMKRTEARGTWVESRLRRQIHTFWIATVAGCAVLLLGGVLFVTALVATGSETRTRMTTGYAIWSAAWALLGTWVLYRTIRGCMALNARRAVN